MDKNNQQLEKRVVELEKQLLALQQSSTIPYTIDNSFMGRGFLKTTPVGTPGGLWFENEGFIVTIDGTQAQAPATKYLKMVNPSGGNYWVALYSFSDLP